MFGRRSISSTPDRAPLACMCSLRISASLCKSWARRHPVTQQSTTALYNRSFTTYRSAVSAIPGWASTTVSGDSALTQMLVESFTTARGSILTSVILRINVASRRGLWRQHRDVNQSTHPSDVFESNTLGSHGANRGPDARNVACRSSWVHTQKGNRPWRLNNHQFILDLESRLPLPT